MRASIVFGALVCALLAVSGAQAGSVSGTCHALALSGGGDKAAYEAGVLRGLITALPPSEVAWNVVTGISAGATLSAAFTIFPVGQEEEAVSFVEGIIADLNQASIFKQWPGGVFEGFMNHSSLFDSTPLRDLFTGILAGKTMGDRLVCMGASNLRTGGFERFCDHATLEDVVNAAIASSAIPGVFIDQQLGKDTYVDGGITANVDVVGAVEGCLSLGYAQAQIVVDTVLCSGVNLTDASGDMSKLTVLPVLLRATYMQDFSASDRDVLDAIHAYPDVTFRYIIKPTEPITGSGIDFNQTEMKWMQWLGQTDAKNAVNPPSEDEALLTRLFLEEQQQ